MNWPIEIDNKWRLHIAYTCNCPASAGNTVLLLGIRSVPHALWEADQSIHSSLKKKNTIRNGGSTTLYGAYTVDMVYTVDKGAGAFYSAGQSKEGSVGFGISQHPIFIKLYQITSGTKYE